jgi:hypothetical protein
MDIEQESVAQPTQAMTGEDGIKRRREKLEENEATEERPSKKQKTNEQIPVGEQTRNNALANVLFWNTPPSSAHAALGFTGYPMPSK